MFTVGMRQNDPLGRVVFEIERGAVNKTAADIDFLHICGHVILVFRPCQTRLAHTRRRLVIRHHGFEHGEGSDIRHMAVGFVTFRPHGTEIEARRLDRMR